MSEHPAMPESKKESEAKTSVRATKNDRSYNLPFMAPQVGLEPTTLRLTAGCSAIELLRNIGKAFRFPYWNPATIYSPGPSPAKYHRR